MFSGSAPEPFCFAAYLASINIFYATIKIYLSAIYDLYMWQQGCLWLHDASWFLEVFKRARVSPMPQEFICQLPTVGIMEDITHLISQNQTLWYILCFVNKS